MSLSWSQSVSEKFDLDENIKQNDFRPIEFFSIDENEMVSNQTSMAQFPVGLHSISAFYPEAGFLRMF